MIISEITKGKRNEKHGKIKKKRKKPKTKDGEQARDEQEK